MKKCLAVFVIFLTITAGYGQQSDRATLRLEKKLEKRSVFISELFNDWKHTGEVFADSMTADREKKVITYYLSSTVTHIPIRDEYVEQLKEIIINRLGRVFRNYNIRLIARGRDLEDFVPNYFRQSPSQYDSIRIAPVYRGKPLVTVNNRPVFTRGLNNNHIAVWPSHGYYFNQSLDRWQWQRARLFGTVEDIFPWSFTTQYLVPMLENAGAVVMLPRERDTQLHEVIIDNDDPEDSTSLRVVNGNMQWHARETGFAFSDTVFTGQNPFDGGTYLSIKALSGDSAMLMYVPDIPESGNYAVYVSWGKTDSSAVDVLYRVSYSGGSQFFTLNQCMGAATWIYLGTFWFSKGKDSASGSVTVFNSSSRGNITSDAVRFGGGMGNVARKVSADSLWYTSGKPRWMEGSRYYLQYAGFPDSLVYTLTSGTNDYNDDYLSRGEWVNYLIGPAKPQYSQKYNNGLGIPLDMAIAFHTDAGVTQDDSIIGTLGIYSTPRNNGLFPNGQSKLASRDLTDMIQSQVVGDIRLSANPNWTRRGLWDKEYSEAWRPSVPVMLLELLSHQNLADMQYGLDPRFKFLVSRSVYKGILRYLALQKGIDPVVQPLSPGTMAVVQTEGKSVKVSWSPINDPLEPSACPTGYNVYMKSEYTGFAPPVYITDTFMIIPLPQWETIYSFRVTAINEGGESLPGETMSAALYENDSHPVLIVNAFDRICGPATFDKGDMAGIAWWEDEGVPRETDFSHSGNQYDFNRNSPWLDDDSQGWGASYADREARPSAGNTFNFPFIHGKALRDAGYSFVSVSDEVFESSDFSSSPYEVVDILFGEERGTPLLVDPAKKEFSVFTSAMMNKMKDLIQTKKNIFVSGAYVGTDMAENEDTVAARFVETFLHYTWRANHATNEGMITATRESGNIFPRQLEFNTKNDTDIYRVESPDAIEPSGDGAFRLYRYNSGGRSAGVAFKGSYGTVVLGFPFETVLGDENRMELMKGVMDFLTSTK